MARAKKRRGGRAGGARLSPRAKRILAATFAMALLAGWAAWYFAPRALPPVAVRVLYSETAGCSVRERLLVAGVMQNRVGNRAFGNLPSIEEVARQPGAFSCIDDPANGNWKKTARPDRMSAGERVVWEQCERVMAGEIPRAEGPGGTALVYYHDRSITKPRSWDNAKWRAMLEVSTEHFLFYSIVPAGK
jgi:hypothetical protein